MPDAALPATRVERLDGWDRDPDLYGARRTVTWQVYLDGVLLGNAFTEDEGHRWIADMRALAQRR